MKNVLIVLVVLVGLLCGCASGLPGEPLPQPDISYEAELRLDLSRLRTIRLGSMEVSELERMRYFRVYFPLGHEPDSMTDFLQGVGAATGRGTTLIRNLTEDPERPGFVAPDSVAGDMARYFDWYNKASQRWPGVVHAMAHATPIPWIEGFGDGHVQQEWAYEAHADLVSMWYTSLNQEGLAGPTWFSSWNEPGWRFAGQEFGRYTRVLAETLALAHPEVRVAGPCSAWPYVHRGGAHGWNRWEQHEKAFIDEVGDIIAGYDFHFYSKGHWAYHGDQIAQSPSLFESQREFVDTVWEHGRLESFLDLVAAYQLHRWGGEAKPVIVSEFGRQAISHQFGPWENDFKAWLYMITVTNLWMRLMERPEVQLTVPFILHDASNTPRGMALKNDAGFTRFVDFYQFFSDLQGGRVIADSDSPYLLANAFVDEHTVYLLLHNRRGFPENKVAKVSIDPQLLAGVEIVDIGIKRMVWQGEIPRPHDDPRPSGELRIDSSYSQLDSLDKIYLQGEETGLIRITLSQAKGLGNVQEVFHYSTETVVPIAVDTWHQFPIDVCLEGLSLESVALDLGLYRDGGFPVNPEVMINGTPVATYDLRSSQGIVAYPGVERLVLPIDSVRPGTNTVAIRFPTGVQGGNPRIVAVKLVVRGSRH